MLVLAFALTLALTLALVLILTLALVLNEPFLRSSIRYINFMRILFQHILLHLGGIIHRFVFKYTTETSMTSIFVCMSYACF